MGFVSGNILEVVSDYELSTFNSCSRGEMVGKGYGMDYVYIFVVFEDGYYVFELIGEGIFDTVLVVVVFEVGCTELVIGGE